MIPRIASRRMKIGAIALILALLSIIWLPLGILGVVPLPFALPGESALRTHAGIAVALLLIAAWAFWER